MRLILKIILCLTLLLSGCKTQEKQPASIFRQPNWWERRMDRLETWDRRHGYPVQKTTEATKTVVGYSLVAAGAVAGVLACIWLDSVLKNQADPRIPNNVPAWSP